MHEMSLVQGLFEQLKGLAAENNSTKITKVTMEIGPLCGVVVDSFQFGFEILSSQEPMLKDAELVIEIPEVTYTCTSCGHQETIAGPRPDQCAKCEEFFLTPSGGDDLILKQVEME
jgi:hydrogenase nickel insertion protein HypA